LVTGSIIFIDQINIIQMTETRSPRNNHSLRHHRPVELLRPIVWSPRKNDFKPILANGNNGNVTLNPCFSNHHLPIILLPSKWRSAELQLLFPWNEIFELAKEKVARLFPVLWAPCLPPPSSGGGMVVEKMKSLSSSDKAGRPFNPQSFSFLLGSPGESFPEKGEAGGVESSESVMAWW